ncbi:MAG: hypothetical protein GEV06_28030 [Luteitalea sp.]|nr:hypothetical protein [Luteitalea sp.]
MFRLLPGAMLLFAALLMCSCDSPTETEDLDDPVDVTAPGTVSARDGSNRSFVIQRGDDPSFDETRPYDWRVSFTVTMTLTDAAVNEDDWDMALPLKITASTVTVQQASGGIVTPPTGTEVVHFEQGPASVSGNLLSDVGATVTQNFDIWYWLPNGGKEALITVSYTFTDDDGATATDSVDVLVSS